MDSPPESNATNVSRNREGMGVDQTRVSRVPAFTTQANALLRKNLTFQKRGWKTNCFLISFPIAICLLILVIQVAINAIFSGSDFKCGCEGDVCGLQFSEDSQAPFCAIDHPPAWPGLMQVPRPQFRAAVIAPGFESSSNPATILYTGANPAATALAGNLLISSGFSNRTDSLVEFSRLTPGSGSLTERSLIIETAFSSGEPFYVLENQSCGSNFAEPSFNYQLSPGVQLEYPAECLPTQVVYRDSVAAINNELYTGFRKGDPKGNPEQEINEYVAAYDFGDTDAKNLDVAIYYNETMTNNTSQSPPGYARVSRSMNLAAQAFLRFIQGPQAELPLWFLKEMPRNESELRLDFSSLLGPLFFMWCIQLLFPVILSYLVYEKQRNLRIMMKMHGLGDRAYWAISYGYFLALSITYMFCFVLIGSVITVVGWMFDLSGGSMVEPEDDFIGSMTCSVMLKFIFYMIYINLQIALGFCASTIFRNVKTATVCGYLYVFGFGLMAEFFFRNFLEDERTGRGWIFAMELIPGFSLYRGLYEFSQYSFEGAYQGTSGMKWSNLNDNENGLTTVWGIQIVEWLVILALAFILDEVVPSNPFFLLGTCFKKRSSSASLLKSTSKSLDGEIHLEMEKADVAKERAVVERLMDGQVDSYAIVCDNLKKVYPGTDGNPDKYAVRGLSLAIQKNECFGMLGPNGAGKTSTINMMIGFLRPTSGTAYIHGLDIRKDMNQIYTSMGVCPQHDLIWETLTAKEHLLFYGRLKNLKGTALEDAVNESLRSVNLFSGGVGNKRVGQYSGGMKRRLSVAISLIGDPQVVYMDEPSTGLDPASRNNLWNVVKHAKINRAIILTTHSMEEAEALCDRLGIFVNGQLQCIGDSKELTARYGGIYVLTITTTTEEEDQVVKLVKSLSPNAQRVYRLAGTQKFEIPKLDVEIDQVFAAMEKVKVSLRVQAWGIADTTLEDVFIKVAREGQGDVPLS